MNVEIDCCRRGWGKFACPKKMHVYFSGITKKERQRERWDGGRDKFKGEMGRTDSTGENGKINSIGNNEGVAKCCQF